MEDTNIINNVIISWDICKKNHIYIENIDNIDLCVDPDFFHKKNIHPNNKIVSNIANHCEINKYTIYFDNCSNMNITISEKINHIIFLNCDNIIINITNGLISGMDILHSKNISCKVYSNKIYNISCGNIDTCLLEFDTFSAANTIISTIGSYNVVFDINTLDKKINAITNMSLFNDFVTYFHINNNFSINYINKHGFGLLHI